MERVFIYSLTENVTMERSIMDIKKVSDATITIMATYMKANGARTKNTATGYSNTRPKVKNMKGTSVKANVKVKGPTITKQEICTGLFGKFNYF